MKELIEYEDILLKLNESKEKILKKIYNAILETVDDGYHELPDEQELKKYWVISDDFDAYGFSINKKLGNIDFDEIVKLNENLKKIGFEITCIFANDDVYKYKNGLELCFKRKE